MVKKDLKLEYACVNAICILHMDSIFLDYVTFQIVNINFIGF